MINVNKDSLR